MKKQHGFELWFRMLFVWGTAVGILCLVQIGKPLAASESAPPPDKGKLLSQANRCKAILRASLIDFYLPACVDFENGGYKESMQNGRFVLTGEKFLTLQARQLWFFSALAKEGYDEDAAMSAARVGFKFLQNEMLDSEYGGYFSKVTDDGGERDPRKHAYLNSFALYGLAAYYSVSRDPSALSAAKDLFGVLEANAHDSEYGGYVEFFYRDWKPIVDPSEPRYVGAIGHKTYNTHLHLMEAFAELYRVWPDELLRRRLSELVLINTSTVRHRTFDANVDAWQRNWQLVEEPGNLRASYGHDVECAWLVLDAAQALGMPLSLFQNWASSLCASSIRLGYDQTHGGFFSGGQLGKLAQDTRKTWWVEAEALVSMLEMYSLTGDPTYYELFSQTLDFVETYQVADAGSWWATIAADGARKSDSQRSSPWHGAYHSGRAMILCAEKLESLARR